MTDPWDCTPVHIYVACPLTVGDQWRNVRKSIDAAEALARMGFTPFNPLLGSLHHMVYPHSWDYWLEFDERWLDRCDAAYRLPGESRGADREVAFCRAREIPVLFSLGELLQWAYDAHGLEVQDPDILEFAQMMLGEEVFDSEDFCE